MGNREFALKGLGRTCAAVLFVLTCCGAAVQAYAESVDDVYSENAHEESQEEIVPPGSVDAVVAATEEGVNEQDAARLQSPVESDVENQSLIEENETVLFAREHRGTLLSGHMYAIRLYIGYRMVVDVSGGSLQDGGNIQLWNSNATLAQRWIASEDDNGFLTLVNAGSGKALDVRAALAQNGANVQQYEPNGTLAQQWIAVRGDDGSITLYSALGKDLVLDVVNGSSKAGANVRLYACNGSNAQKNGIRGYRYRAACAR